MSSQNNSISKEKTLKWVSVELSSLGEHEKNPEVIKGAVHRYIGDVDVFVPSVSMKRQEEEHTLCYMEGYVFIEYKDGINYMHLQDIPLFKTVLHTVRGGAISYNLIDDKVLNPMRDGVEALKHVSLTKDDPIKVNKGVYKNLLGTVSQVYDDDEVADPIVQVYINLRSKKVLIDFPASYLDNLRPKKK